MIYKGTAVPNSGIVEKIYFNTSLSVEEVIDIVTSINHDFAANFAYYVLYNEEVEKVISIAGQNPSEALIIAIEGGIIFAHGMEEFGLAEGWNAELANTPYIVNGDALSTFTDEDGTVIKIGNFNEGLSSLISTTQFEVEMPDIKWKGTTVPNSGNVENIYLNKNLTIEEVVTILDTLGIQEQVDEYGDSIGMYGVATNGDETKGVAVIKVNGDYVILVVVDNDPVPVFASNAQSILGYAGWAKYDPVYMVNDEVVGETIGVGVKNTQLSALFSITPFEEIKEIDESNPFLKWVGTPIQNSGILQGGIYINTNLSIEEVNEIIDSVSFQVDGSGYAYPVLFGVDPEGKVMVLIFMRLGNDYMILLLDHETEHVLYRNLSGGFIQSEIDAPGYINNDFAGFLNVTLADNAEGFPCGNNNDLITGLISSTPFERVVHVPTGEEFLTDCCNAIRYVEGNAGTGPLIGTPIPNNGFVYKVYANTTLTTEEVDKLLEETYNNNLTELITVIDGVTYYNFGFLCVDTNNHMYFSVDVTSSPERTVNKYNIIIMVEGSPYQIYSSDNGWTDPNLIYGVEVGASAVEYANVVNGYGENMNIYFGKYNDKLSSLFSIKPFEREPEKIPAYTIPKRIRKLLGNVGRTEVAIQPFLQISNNSDNNIYDSNEQVITAMRNILQDIINDGHKLFRSKIISDGSSLTTEMIEVNSADEMPIIFDGSFLIIGITESEIQSMGNLAMLLVFGYAYFGIPHTWGVMLPDDFVFNVYSASLKNTYSINVSISGKGVCDLSALDSSLTNINVELKPHATFTLSD